MHYALFDTTYRLLIGPNETAGACDADVYTALREDEVCKDNTRDYLAVVRVATVRADGHTFTGRVYHVRDNGWPCVQTSNGRVASGPEVEE